MTEAQTWLLIGLLAGLPFAIWAWRHFDAGRLSVTYDSGPPDEPRWTEETIGPDGLGYGRAGGYQAKLDEMERRARRGEFDTPS